MTRAFVAGATGYTGREVVRALVERGVATIAHVRPESPRLAEWRGRFLQMGAQVDVTPWHEDEMTATFAARRPDAVFALHGTTRTRASKAARAGRVETYQTVDYGLTRLLVRALAGAGLAPRFVYLSSIGARPDARSAYLFWRGRAEEEVRAGGLPYVIARPAFVTGPDRDEWRPVERVGAWISDGLLALAGAFGATRLRARYRSITATDLAAALVRLGLAPEADVVVEADGLRTGGSP